MIDDDVVIETRSMSFTDTQNSFGGISGGNTPNRRHKNEKSYPNSMSNWLDSDTEYPWSSFPIATTFHCADHECRSNKTDCDHLDYKKKEKKLGSFQVFLTDRIQWCTCKYCRNSSDWNSQFVCKSFDFPLRRMYLLLQFAHQRQHFRIRVYISVKIEKKIIMKCVVRTYSAHDNHIQHSCVYAEPIMICEFMNKYLDNHHANLTN